MLNLFLRDLKRFVILLPALLVVIVSVFNILPLLNGQLPLLLAIILTYILAAYVLIPGLIRLYRVFFPVKHLPHYSVTRDGFASDPINIGIIGTRNEVIAALKQAGWQTADSITLRTILKVLINFIQKDSYPTAPMSSLYLIGRRQDLSFQSALEGKGHDSRHHVRFWATRFDEDSELTVKTIDWQKRREHVREERLLWLGAASRDIGITLTRHSIQFTHMVDSDTDLERDYLVRDLIKDTELTMHRTVTFGKPYTLLNIHALSGRIETDGTMKVLEMPATDRTAA